MTISISIDQTLRRIYAMSALRAYSLSNKVELPILTSDFRGSLAELVADAFADLTLRLARYVTEFDLPDNPAVDDILSVTFRPGATPNLASALSSAIAGYIAYGVLSAIYSESDAPFSAEQARAADASMNTISQLLAIAALPATPLFVDPHG